MQEQSDEWLEDCLKTAQNVLASGLGERCISHISSSSKKSTFSLTKTCKDKNRIAIIFDLFICGTFQHLLFMSKGQIHF